MTIEELKQKATVSDLEAIGGCHWEIDEDLFAKLIVEEVIEWCKPMLGMSKYDELALRAYLQC